MADEIETGGSGTGQGGTPAPTEQGGGTQAPANPANPANPKPTGQAETQQTQVAPANPLGLSQDMVNAFSSKGWKSADDMAKSYLDLEGKVGADTIIPPSVNATPEEIAKWDGWSKLGVPSRPEDYEIKIPEGREFSEQDKAFHEFMRPKIHDARLAPWQLDIIGGAFTEFMDGQQGDLSKAMNERREQAEQSLKSEWGSKYDENLALADAVIRRVGGDALGDEIQKSGIGNNIELIKGMLKVAGVIEGDGELLGSGPLTFGQSPAAAAAEIRKLEGDKEFQTAFLNRSHPQHKEAYDRMMRLQAAAGEQAA